MRVEVALLAEVARAEGALVEEVRVHLAHVLLEVTALRERARAEVALEALSLVDALMALLVGLRGEALVTVATGVHLLP